MSVEPIRHHDVTCVTILLQEIYKELTGTSVDLDRDVLFDHLFGRRRLTWALVYKEENRVVGVLFYESKYMVYSQKEYMHVSFIGVAKNYRKKNIAQKMLDKIEDLSIKKDMAGMCCDIHNINIVSRSFFKKNGFIESKGTREFQKKFE